MYSGIFLSSTSNSTSLELGIQFHGPAKTAVSELFSPLGNVFTHAHQVLQNKLIKSYQRPTSEAPKSIFKASAENGLNKHPNVQRQNEQKEHEKNTTQHDYCMKEPNSLNKIKKQTFFSLQFLTWSDTAS